MDLFFFFNDEVSPSLDGLPPAQALGQEKGCGCLRRFPAGAGLPPFQIRLLSSLALCKRRVVSVFHEKNVC